MAPHVPPPDDDAAPGAAPGGPARTRAVRLAPRAWTMLLAALILLPSLLGMAAWYASATHQVVPGLTGCRFVRERAPQIDCYTAQFRSLMHRDGLAAAMQRIDRVAHTVPTLAADCHLAWHPIGEADGVAASRNGDYHDIDVATTCQEGYAHGFTIGYLSNTELTTASADRLLVRECGADETRLQVINCTHSFGHVFARHADGDVERAHGMCSAMSYDRLPAAAGGTTFAPDGTPDTGLADAARYQCYYGMYMEFGIIDLRNEHAPVDNCAGGAPSPLALRACYAYLSARAIAAADGDIAAGAVACTRHAPPGELRRACVVTYSMGLDRAGRCTALADPADRETCRRVVATRT